MRRKVGIILLACLALLVAWVLLDVGWEDWPNLHRINIGQGMLQIHPADILISLKPVVTVLLIVLLMGPEIIREFKRGYNGEK
jgi:hypothetical protein